MKRFECRWVREPNPPSYAGKRIACAEDIANLSREMVGQSPREIFMVWFLNGRHQVLGFQIIHQGTGVASLVDPGDVMGQVLLSGAYAWVAVHNHPSGDPSPSSEDIALTNELRKAGKLLRRELLDHIVIGDLTHFSMAADGLMGTE